MLQDRHYVRRLNKTLQRHVHIVPINQPELSEVCNFACFILKFLNFHLIVLLMLNKSYKLKYRCGEVALVRCGGNFAGTPEHFAGLGIRIMALRITVMLCIIILWLNRKIAVRYVYSRLGGSRKSSCYFTTSGCNNYGTVYKKILYPRTWTIKTGCF